MLGNALEWYDYALYASFATIIGEHFFPTQDPVVSIIATFGVFAAGFIVRPLGGVFFGRLGDKYGRKATLSIAILLMALPTTCIGLLPTYEQIGILAPILLTIIRLLQGLSLGGEFSGCIAYVVEHSPKEYRGMAGSTAFCSMCAGMLMGSLTATFMSTLLGYEELVRWGWRIPFLLGIIIGAIGFHIRMHLDESPVYENAKQNNNLSPNPMTEIYNYYFKELIIATGMYLTVTVPFYTLTVFVNNFMQTYLNFEVEEALLINSLALALMIMVMPLSAWISDNLVGRRSILVYSTIALIIGIIPIFWMFTNPSFASGLIGQLLFAVIVSFFMGPIPTTLVELFPTRVRFTGVAISYNLSAALFGGTAPMVGFWLIDSSGYYASVALYIIVHAIFTLFTLKYFVEKPRQELV
jgi:MHS family proline/betaine transporter-like MFS transporter